MPLVKRKQPLELLVKNHPRLLHGRSFALALCLDGIVTKDARSLYVEAPRIAWHGRKIKR